MRSIAEFCILGAIVTGAVACVDDVEVPPKPPTLLPVTTPTPVPMQKLRGSRPANTAIVRGGEIVVPSGPETSWELEVALEPGDNSIDLFTQRPSGLRSKSAATAVIAFEQACPATPTLTAQLPLATNQRALTLTGTKAKGTSVAVNGAELVAADAQTTFSSTVMLAAAEGPQVLTITTRDAKGKISDPLQVSVTYDVTAPSLATRYPTAATDSVVANTNIPTTSSVFVELSEPVRSISGTVDSLVTIMAGGNPVAGATTLVAGGKVALWTAAAPLTANTSFDVIVDAAAVRDLAGNAPQVGASWTWSFRTGAGPSTMAPSPPTATAPASVSARTVTISGTREPWSAIWINGALALAPGAASWSVDLPVSVGTNPYAVVARSASGVPAPGPTLMVSYAVNKPRAPAVDAQVPKLATAPSHTLTGTKPAGTGISINGAPAACLSDETTWAAVVTLTPGVNDLRITARTAEGVESDPLLFSVDLGQTFSGKVPSGWQLKVSMTLRDLTATSAANEFVTGSNNYGVDVWVEGPVQQGEVCEFDAANKQRRNVRYVATIEHYVGVKSGHTVPFADEDYRGTDYVAALAHGGMLSFLGISGQTPRRDGQGRENPMLLARLSEQDLRQKIDCFGLLGIDGCTEATVKNGPHVVRAWEPRRPPNAELIDQGEYLLWVMINLDRGGGWLIANDTETCWANAADLTRGMHRVVRRIPLGSAPWSVNLTPDDEVSGNDPNGAVPLKFLSPEGLTISWGPP